MNMATGMAEPTLASDINGALALQKLLLCFIAVYERQVLCRAFTFMFHNYLEGQEDFDTCVNQSLKYNTLSPHGIACTLRPYLHLAYQKGYLTPEDCEESAFAARVIQLFPSVHAKWEEAGEKGAREWIMEYVFEMLTDPQVVAEEALLAGDVSEERGSSGSDASSDGGEGQDVVSMEEEEQEETPFQCMCDFCEEMRSYDIINLDAIQSKDPLDAIIINGMKKALRKTLD